MLQWKTSKVEFPESLGFLWPGFDWCLEGEITVFCMCAKGQASEWIFLLLKNVCDDKCVPGIWGSWEFLGNARFSFLSMVQR